MFVVDTNILVHAADIGAPEHERYRTLVEAWRQDELPWYCTWPILNEFLRVVTHPKVLSRPWDVAGAWGFVEALLASPSLTLLLPGERHVDVVRRTIREHPDLRGNILHDAHTAILMREHGLRRIYSRDQDFRRFPFVELVDPGQGD